VEQLEFFVLLIKSNSLQKVLYGVHMARMLICELQDRVKEVLSDEIFLIFYNIALSKHNTQILVRLVFTK
jgi:hypothetical protein